MEQRIKQMDAKAQGAAAAITGVVVVLMLFMIAANTVLRYGFNISWNFAEEYTAYGLIFMTFVPLGWTLRERAHIAIEVVIDRLSARVSRWVMCAAGAVSLVTASFMFFFAVRLMLTSLERGVRANTYMLTPIWIPQSFIVVGLLLFIIEIVFYIVHYARGGSAPECGTEEGGANG